jgi:hypothetical protein
VGLPGSPDLKAAREVADFLGTDHHEFTFTVQVRGDMGCGLSPATGWCDWDLLVCKYVEGSTQQLLLCGFWRRVRWLTSWALTTPS